MNSKNLGLLCAGLLLCQPAAAAEPRVLEPSSPWQLNFADDSCRLARSFGSGDDKTILYIERFDPGDRFYLVVAGKPLQLLDKSNGAKLTFGPEFAAQDVRFRRGALGTLEPAMFVVAAYLQKRPESDRRHPYAALPAGSGPDGQQVTAAQEAAVEWIDIAPESGNGSLRLATGSLGKSLAAMRDCTSELMLHWPIDAEAHRHLTRQAQPASNPGTWITPADFPGFALFRGERGLVFFRLDVDAKGRVSGCHVQHSAGRDLFEKAVCTNMERHGRFKPALDAAGQPIASYWSSSVMFDYPE